MTANQPESRRRTPPSRMYPLCWTTYNGQIASMPRSPGLSNEKFEAVNQIALTKAISISKKPSTNQSRHRVSQGCGVGPMEVALGKLGCLSSLLPRRITGMARARKGARQNLDMRSHEGNARARIEKRWKMICNRLNNRYSSIDRTWTAVKK